MLLGQRDAKTEKCGTVRFRGQACGRLCGYLGYLGFSHGLSREHQGAQGRRGPTFQLSVLWQGRATEATVAHKRPLVHTQLGLCVVLECHPSLQPWLLANPIDRGMQRSFYRHLGEGTEANAYVSPLRY